jgi:hypothetical protein
MHMKMHRQYNRSESSAENKDTVPKLRNELRSLVCPARIPIKYQLSCSTPTNLST